jgi:exosortase C (VPDSG-CTERM-specific)
LKNERQELAAACLEPAKNPGFRRNFISMIIVLMLAFSIPLYDLARFAAGNDLYSYILLIPFVSIYLARLQRAKLPRFSGAARMPATIFFAGGATVLAGYGLGRYAGIQFTEEDWLALMTAAFILIFVGGCYWTLGKEIVKALAFPIGFLVFMVPLPTFLLNGVESFLQQGSALAAAGFFHLSGATFFRDGLIFELPTISLRVAPECSGIHSTIVLFITSSVAGHLFLRSPWRRVILVLAVLPLALLRNGFRVYVIGELCTHIGPQMIDSPIHHRGGPLFLVLSLIPFFLLLFFLRKSEQSAINSKTQ